MASFIEESKLIVLSCHKNLTMVSSVEDCKPSALLFSCHYRRENAEPALIFLVILVFLVIHWLSSPITANSEEGEVGEGGSCKL